MRLPLPQKTECRKSQGPKMVAKTSIADYLLQRIIGSSSHNFKYHLKECLMRLPEEDLRAIAYERNVHVLAASTNAVVTLEPVLYDPGKGDLVLVVFTTDFDKCPAHEIVYTIAHEFAHVFLDHFRRASWHGHESEIEADRQVVAWGFERQLRQTPSNYLGWKE